MGGGGGKFSAEIYPESGWWAGLDVQINWARMTIDNVRRAGETSTTQSGKATAQDFQLAALLSKRMELDYASDWFVRRIVPYGGVKLSSFRLKRTVTFQTPTSGSFVISGRRKNDHGVGFVAGIEVDWQKDLQFRIEGTVLDDLSLSASLSWIF